MLDKVARKYKALNNTKLCMYFIYKEEKGIYSGLADISMKNLTSCHMLIFAGWKIIYIYEIK